MNDNKREFNIARNILNGTGFIGRIAKLFFGKNMMSVFAGSFRQAESQFNYHQKQQQLKESGTPARAEVLSMEETGTTVNYYPVADMTLKVMPDNAREFTVTIQTSISNVNIPRQGDIVKVKYNPQNTDEVVIVR